MIISEKIQAEFPTLLEIVKNEAKENPITIELFNYLNEYNSKFMSDSNTPFKGELKEFLRGANRYSDEFSFSEKYYSKIREAINGIYELLNA